MRRLILAALTANMLVPVAASAQSGELRRDRQEVQRDRAEVRQDVRRGDRQEAREDRQELREDQREHREDWQQYRRGHQSQFRQGHYTAPRGHAWRSVRIGSSLHPAFYNSRYWINNPYSYRLPRASVGTRYVRYGNDVVLINARTGRVLRVYNNFFY